MYYGDLGKRFVASIIDSLILTVIGFLVAWMLGGAAFVVIPIVSWLYFILMEGGSWHATAGKRIMGMYVAYEDGNGITYSTAILRMIGKMLSSAIIGIGYIMCLFNDQKQCLHDMIAKTVVLEGQVDEANVRQNAGRRIKANNSPKVRSAAGTLPELIGISGPLAGTVYQVDENGLILGRDNISCNVVIPDSQGSVSRIHCYVTFNPMSGMFIINDRNSTQGTFLANGERIPYAKPIALKSGDRFYLATPENTFEVR